MNTDKIYAEAVANEYSVKQNSKVIALKKLDRKAKLPANVTAYSLGCISSLVLGFGMCLSMNVIGSGSTAEAVFGIIVGIFGLAGISVNYFLYRRLLEKGKQKYASDIIRMASEISEEQ